MCQGCRVLLFCLQPFPGGFCSARNGWPGLEAFGWLLLAAIMDICSAVAMLWHGRSCAWLLFVLFSQGGSSCLG